MARNYFWTKTWGAPDKPKHDALALSHQRTRERILEYIRPGDIVVYLTSDGKEADPMLRGRLAGAVEIADPVEIVDVESLRPGVRRPPEHYREDGRFRWPYGIAVSRCWGFIEQEQNDTLIPNHADLRMQGAATIHPMEPEEIGRLMALEVREVVEGEEPSRLPFSGSLQRPWRQKARRREGADVEPGTELYIALIADGHGLTFKVGSGKTEERLRALNAYRRGSEGEVLWSIKSKYEFASVEAARAAEDYILEKGKAAGHGSPDNREFLIGITMRSINELFSEAIVVGLAEDERVQYPAVAPEH
jgi:hypothetical protein